MTVSLNFDLSRLAEKSFLLTRALAMIPWLRSHYLVYVRKDDQEDRMGFVKKSVLTILPTYNRARYLPSLEECYCAGLPL